MKNLLVLIIAGIFSINANAYTHGPVTVMVEKYAVSSSTNGILWFTAVGGQTFTGCTTNNTIMYAPQDGVVPAPGGYNTIPTTVTDGGMESIMATVLLAKAQSLELEVYYSVLPDNLCHYEIVILK